MSEFRRILSEFRRIPSNSVEGTIPKYKKPMCGQGPRNRWNLEPGGPSTTTYMYPLKAQPSKYKDYSASVAFDQVGFERVCGMISRLCSSGLQPRRFDGALNGT